jgi:hypothetical protein
LILLAEVSRQREFRNPAPPEDSAAGEPATAAPLSSDDQYSLKHMTGVVQRLKADLAAERKKTDVARQEARQAIQRAQELQLKLEREQAETKRLRTQQTLDGSASQTRCA